MTYDLHVHSTASDGVYTPEEVVVLAQQLGLTGLALTDHDTIDGIEAAVEAGEKLGLDIIPGIEINTDYGQREVHILGYGINPQAEALVANLANIKAARVSRGRKMIDKLNQLQLPMDWEDVVAKAAGGIVGRPHIALVMINKGYVRSVTEAFSKFLGRGKPAYEPRYKLTPQEAISMINEAGGCPILAHPGLINDKWIANEVVKLVKGIEVHYPEHSLKETQEWEQYAKKYGLLITGGSDFHGLPGNKNCLGKQTASNEDVAKLKASYL
ncbi:MAG: PHP domain-containing protein [Methanomassiliicoccales archaeon]